MDMALLEKENIDVALLPIGGTYTMDSDDALQAVKLIKPKYVIPMHYNTTLTIEQNPETFKQRVEEETTTKVKILTPGETFKMEGV
jgi:L-ascorbate metabolism protein UlaG (beta-lactamase superfamily)